MKRLILMRHAKSSWADPGQRDIDRPLNKRGLGAAALLGRWLVEQDVSPDHALVSGARRTRQTWEIVQTAIGERPVDFLPALYDAGPEAIRTILRGAPDDDCVLLIGHQPGIGEAALRLIADPPDDDDLMRYPTGATAVIEFDLSQWSSIAWGSGRLVQFTAPRRLQASFE